MVCIIEKLQMLTMGAINAIASILIPSLCLVEEGAHGYNSLKPFWALKMTENTKYILLSGDGQKSILSLSVLVSAATKSEINYRWSKCQLGWTLFGCGPSTTDSLESRSSWKEHSLSLNMLIFQVCNLTFLMCKMGVECGSDRIIQLKWRVKERGGKGEGDGGGGKREKETDWHNLLL